MLNLNLTMICGNLGDEPKLYNADPNKKAMLTGRLATNEYYKDAQGQKQKRTTWYDFVIFGKRAEAFAQYFHKGSAAFLQGQLREETYNSNLKPYYCYNADGTPLLDQNGQHFVSYVSVERKQLKLYVEDWKFADSKKPENTAYPQAPVAGGPVAPTSGEPVVPTYGAPVSTANVASTFTRPATGPVAPPTFSVNGAMPSGV